MSTSDKIIQLAISSCSREIMMILFYIGLPSFIQLFQVGPSFQGDFCGMKAFISFWSGELPHVFQSACYSHFDLIRAAASAISGKNILIYELKYLMLVSHLSTIGKWQLFHICIFNVEQALGYPYFLGHHRTLVRSDEY